MTGTVQGVGFRPFVFRLAERLDLAGWVRNDEHGVLLEAEGDGEAVERLLALLRAEAPPLAAVEAVDAAEAPATGERGFRIAASERHGTADAPVTPDSATCADCLAEVLDPADRRHRYPFANCTNCGPRFTIVRGVPYDRPLTTMAGFAMCDACRAEYDDPRDRRFHAQPNACPECGPRARLIAADGSPVPAPDAVAAAAAALRAGRIVAVKGIGGYHLACRADDERAVAALRTRKHREDKPFALMAADAGRAAALVELSPADAELLAGPARPIVLAPRRAGDAVAPSVAPRSRDLGVMLPYSALHHLLLADAGATLVMTSANVSDEPIAHEDDDALRRLGGIADLLLVHDRPIHVRTDDSVVRSIGPAGRAGRSGGTSDRLGAAAPPALGRGVAPERPSAAAPLVLRRSRGLVPGSIPLPLAAAEPVLGCGAELKATFCLAKGRRAWVGHHVGDLRNLETLASYRAGIEHFERVFAVRPAVVAHDLHPDYLSTRHAESLDGVELVGVQHHHAHLAACLAEHGERGPAVGAILDGSGLGPDGTVWGGELLAGDMAACERAGALLAVRLPGGDAAVREPWRMACSWLVAALDVDVPPIPPALRDDVGEREWAAVARMARGGTAAPLTTSAGRLFDAVAALCGVRARTTYEGQAAAELEGLADARERSAYPLAVVEGGGDATEPSEAGAGVPGLVLDARETIRAVAADVARGTPVGTISARFHNALADATATACSAAAERAGTDPVALGGGVFQNRMLLERAVARLRAERLRPLVPERLPPNDGGISYGQVAVAIARRGGGS